LDADDRRHGGRVHRDPANISVDASGYLHLKIVKNGAAWSASEVFTTSNLGFGTYQWQIAGPLDRMENTVVLGLFPYGPQAGIGADGTNEIDTEFSFWNDELTNVNADWGVYPPSTSAVHWEDDFFFSLDGGAAATTRMVWSSTGIAGTLMSGFQPLAATQSVLATTSYMPPGNMVSLDIPQQAVPLGMNLWCYKGPPASGQNVEIVIQDFQFVPAGQPLPGDDGGLDAGDDAAAVDATVSSDSGGSDATTTPADAAQIRDSAAGSTDAANGSSPDGGTGASSDSGSSSGCGCRTAETRALDGGPLFAVGALAALAMRRRRSSPRPSR
jgi:MYXO-CTERM domain-containing protein